MAAPMQSMWVGTSLARHLQQLFTHEAPIEHMEVLNALKREMFGFAKEMYPTIQPALHTPEPKQLYINQVKPIGGCRTAQKPLYRTLQLPSANFMAFHMNKSASVMPQVK
jgi:hypothetical protein